MTPWLQNPTHIFGHPFHLFICWFTNSLNVNAFKLWLMRLGGSDQGPAFDDNESACVSPQSGVTLIHTHIIHTIIHQGYSYRLFTGPPASFWLPTRATYSMEKLRFGEMLLGCWICEKLQVICIPLSCRGELLGMMERPNYDSPSGININLFSFIWIFTRQKSSLGISKTLRSKT